MLQAANVHPGIALRQVEHIFGWSSLTAMDIYTVNILYPLAALAIPQCLLLAGLAIRPSPYRWVLWPVIASINCCSHYMLNPTHYFATTDLIRVVLLGCVFVASDFLLLTDVQRELHLVNQRPPISNFGFWDRLKWAIKLFVGTRGVGWNHEPKSALPPHPNTTRLQFLITRFCRLAVCGLITDVANIFIRSNPFFVPDSPPCVQQPWSWRFWGVFLFAISLYGNVTLVHNVGSTFCVGSGLSNPDMWPHMFGEWGDAYTVRRFWGRTWHQVMRRFLTSHGKFLAHKVFRFPPGGILSSYTQLYTAFLISGIVHCPPSDARPTRFFLSQAVCITFEDAVIALAARAGWRYSNKFHRILGYMWVYCWFVYSIPPWMDSMTSAGVLYSGSINFSLVLGVYCGEWFPVKR